MGGGVPAVARHRAVVGGDVQRSLAGDRADLGRALGLTSAPFGSHTVSTRSPLLVAPATRPLEMALPSTVRLPTGVGRVERVRDVGVVLDRAERALPAACRRAGVSDDHPGLVRSRHEPSAIYWCIDRHGNVDLAVRNIFALRLASAGVIARVAISAKSNLAAAGSTDSERQRDGRVAEWHVAWSSASLVSTSCQGSRSNSVVSASSRLCSWGSSTGSVVVWSMLIKSCRPQE